jgi:hypothetical protein
VINQRGVSPGFLEVPSVGHGVGHDSSGSLLWTQHDRLFRAMVAQGFSASRIARDLPFKVSAAAVRARAYRLGLRIAGNDRRPGMLRR